ncbi:MAG: DUF861 domain-containing protein [Flavobacteriales bacterium]|nr:DUF861 domain-containing protein [Flavobacteriales bacterium]
MSDEKDFKDRHPSKFTNEEIDGSIFDHKDADASMYNETTPVVCFPNLSSSDKKFETGMYKSGPLHESYPGGYGFDEFMYLITGSVTLTSADGTVTEIKAGEAVSMHKEWNGTWDTEGYTKLYVMYGSEGL